MQAIEIVKYLIYRMPGARRLMAPHYSYKINPGELAALVGFIDDSKEEGGAVIEVGVAHGDSSVFLLEHLKTTDPGRVLLLFDTFAGFTKDSIDYEMTERGKNQSPYRSFRYGNARLFERNLRAAGYTNFRIYEGDAAAFDWSTIAPISAALLDVDLYKPTAAILKGIWPHLTPSGGIVVDDCLPNTPWDGALQAYKEFVDRRGLPFVRVGHKGALIRPQRKQ